MDTRILFSTNDLKNENTKAEHIGFDREEALGGVLWSHIATKTIGKGQIVYMADLYYNVHI